MLFVGDDWAEDHHDVEVQDEAGRRLGKAKLAEGIAGIARLHELLAERLEEDAEAEQVVVGIETDRGPWVQALLALLAAGYRVWAINPLQVARYRERRSVSGAKSDAADAHTLADMVRTDRHQLRPIAGDSDWPRRSRWSPAPTRRCSGSGPGTCCGCGWCCGSSSQPRWRPSPSFRPPRRWSCWAGRPIPSQRPG